VSDGAPFALGVVGALALVASSRRGAAAREAGWPSDRSLRRRALDYLGSGLCEDEVFYHVAPRARIASIAREGLVRGGYHPPTFPDFAHHAEGRVFFAQGLDAASEWRRVIETGQKAGRPATVLLRVVPAARLDRLVRYDWQGASTHECSFFSMRPVPPEALEWLDVPEGSPWTASGPWRPLSTWRPPHGSRAEEGYADDPRIVRAVEMVRASPASQDGSFPRRAGDPRVLGSGAHRVAFRLSPRLVVKVGWDAAGALVNLVEADAWAAAEAEPVARRWLVPVRAVADDGTWLVMDYAAPRRLGPRATIDAMVADMGRNWMRRLFGETPDLALRNWGVHEGLPKVLDYGQAD
jgi:hypothetical protein